MILHKLVVSIQIILFVFYVESNEIPAELILDHETNVSQYYQRFQNDLPEIQEGTDSSIALQKLKNILILILKQLYNYHKLSFPTRAEMNSQVKGNYEIKIKFVYVGNVCSYIVRIIDYLYVSTPYSDDDIVKMYGDHNKYCKSTLRFLNNECHRADDKPSNDNSTIFICHIIRLNIFYTPGINFETLPHTINMEEPDYQDLAVRFLETQHRLLDDIDWTVGFNSNNAKYDIYNSVPLLQSSRDKRLLVWGTNQCNKYIILDEKLKNYNNMYISDIKNNDQCEPPAQQLENETSVPIVVSKLLLHTFREIQIHFQYELRKISDNNTFRITKWEIINDLLSNVFNRLCDYSPKILLYLFSESESESETIKTLYSLYFSFCGNHMNFADSRCPTYEREELKGLEIQYFFNMKCITQSIINKLLWNYYTLTNEVINEKYTYNETCAELHLKYLHDIHTAVAELYEIDQETKLWTTQAWMSGKRLITKNYVNNDINDLKNANVNIGNTTFPLEYAYTYFLPLNTNMDSVFIFHNIILYNLDAKINNYIYIHAITIMKYISHTNPRKINKSTRERVRKSMEWCESKFFSEVRSYLNLTAERDVSNNGLKVIDFMKNISKYSSMDSLQQIIPKDIFSKLSTTIEKYIDSELLKVKAVNDMLNANCNKALRFVSDIILIAQKSMATVDDSEKFSLSQSYDADGLESAEYDLSLCENLDETFPDNLANHIGTKFRLFGENLYIELFT